MHHRAHAHGRSHASRPQPSPYYPRNPADHLTPLHLLLPPTCLSAPLLRPGPQHPRGVPHLLRDQVRRGQGSQQEVRSAQTDDRPPDETSCLANSSRPWLGQPLRHHLTFPASPLTRACHRPCHTVTAAWATASALAGRLLPEGPYLDVPVLPAKTPARRTSMSPAPSTHAMIRLPGPSQPADPADCSTSQP